MISKFTELEKTLGNGHRPYRYRVQIRFPQGIYTDGDDVVNTLVKSTTIPGVRIQQRNFYHKGHIIPLSGMKVYDQEWSATFYLDENFIIRKVMDRWVQVQDSFLSGVMPVVDKETNASLLGSTIMKDGLDLIKKGVASAVDNLIDSVIPSVSNSVVSGYSTPMGEVDLQLGQDMLGSLKKTQTFLKDTNENSTDGSLLYGEVVITALDIDDSEVIVVYTLHNAFPIAIQQVTLDDSMTSNISEFTCSFAFSHYTISKPKSLFDAFGGLGELKNRVNGAVDSALGLVGL